MRFSDAYLDQLRDALRADIGNVAEALLGPRNKAASSAREWRWGAKGGLRVHVSGPKRGGWSDFNGTETGDPFGLIRHARGSSFPDTVAWGSSFTGFSPDASHDHEEDERRRAERAAARAAERAQQDAEDRVEAARQLREARRIASEAVSIEGTLGCHYLRQVRGIPRPAAGWPNTVRWHGRLRAVVVVATLPDGTVQRVQRIHLGEDGRKISDAEREVRKLKAVKLTNGPLARDAAVRLPGSGVGPLLLAEGPETALAVWAATGHETWSALGTVSNLTPPAGRPVVVCRDDDEQHSKGDTAHAKTVATWRKAGLDVRVATPWPVRRGDKSDLATVILAEGAERVRARVQLALSRKPADVAARVEVGEARQQVEAVVEDFFERVDEGSADLVERLAVTDKPKEVPRPKPFTYGARVSTGVGKSHGARLGIARTLVAMRSRGDERTIVMPVPRHALGDEQAAAFTAIPAVREAREAGLEVKVWRGRSAPDPDHADYNDSSVARPNKTTMCVDLERVHDVQAIGLKAQEAACGSSKGKQCPAFARCAYQRQQKQKADLWIMSHDMLFHRKPNTMGEVAAVIVDEQVWRKGLIGAEGAPISLSVGTFSQDATILHRKSIQG